MYFADSECTSRLIAAASSVVARRILIDKTPCELDCVVTTQFTYCSGGLYATPLALSTICPALPNCRPSGCQPSTAERGMPSSLLGTVLLSLNTNRSLPN